MDENLKKYWYHHIGGLIYAYNALLKINNDTEDTGPLLKAYESLWEKYDHGLVVRLFEYVTGKPNKPNVLRPKNSKYDDINNESYVYHYIGGMIYGICFAFINMERHERKIIPKDVVDERDKVVELYNKLFNDKTNKDLRDGILVTIFNIYDMINNSIAI